jgi:hypothetical protein
MMLRIYIFILMFGVAIARAEDTNAVADAKAPAAVEPEPGSFDEFKLITRRNIFDPNRSAPGRPRRTEETPKPKRIDYMNLVGAMSYEKGRFAFFDGSSSEYRKSVKLGDSIAGYKVADVTANKVTLASGDKRIELPVGGQLKREDEGEWRLNSTPESFATSGSGSSDSSSSTSTSDASSSSSAGSGSEETNPILRKLLEQRRQGK